MNQQPAPVESDPKTMWNKNYTLLLVGQWISQIGNAAYAVALPLYVLKLTGSPLMLGVVMAAALVPFTLLGPFAGVMADRWSRKTLIVVSDLLSGCLVLAVALMAWRGQMTIALLVGTAALLSVCSSFFVPAVMASVPNLVPRDRLTRSMALIDTARHISLIAGPALGAGLIFWLGFPGAFLINGLSFILSGFSESFMRIPQSSNRTPFFLFAELATGWRFIARHRLLLGVTCVVMMINLFEPAVIPVVMPVLVQNLGLPLATYGLLRAVFGAGSLAAVIALGTLREQANRRALIVGSMVVIGASFVLMGIVVQYWALLALIAAYGLAAGLANTLVMVEIQVLLPDGVRARVFGVVAALSAAMMPISYIGIGSLLGFVTPLPIMAAAGLVTVVGAFAYRLVTRQSTAA